MERINIFEYDRKNMKEIEYAIAMQESELHVLQSSSIVVKLLKKEQTITFSENYFYDFTPIMISEGDRTSFWSPEIIGILNEYFENVDFNVYFIVDKRYSNEIREALYHYVNDIESLEQLLNIHSAEVKNVVDLSEEQFQELQSYIKENLFGNIKFQIRLFQELRNYRLFNKISEQKVFSVFICGQSGIGKTETARLVHNFLCSNEKFIKINLGNYSDQNALSSLIGSPRGYIGSSKGELSDKIFKSKSKVILIDEFEKAGIEVHNFFLELLEDGKFTDSLGREFNLNKYIIIFTSNIKEEDISKKISPELQSRFSLMYKFSAIADIEKEKYLLYKGKFLIDKIEQQLNIHFSEEAINNIYGIELKRFSNLRKLNKEIMLRISQEYQKLVDKEI